MTSSGVIITSYIFFNNWKNPNFLQSTSNGYFENQPNEICSYLSEKASKGMFLKPEKLQHHSNEGKRTEKKKGRGVGKEEKREREKKKKQQWLHS